MSLSLRRTPNGRASSSASVNGEAESWFLERGLPSVLTRRARWRRLWSRSAPMLAAYATLQASILPIHLITGGHDVDITGKPTPSEVVILTIIGSTLPLMALVGWLVSRSRSGRVRTAIAALAVGFVGCVATIVAGPGQLLQEAVVILVVLVVTGSGVGSVVGWAWRMMLSHFATIGALAVRGLPVVLLTALVFFNTYVWLMAATISGNRLGLAVAFLVSIAAAFVVSATHDRVRRMLRSEVELPDDPSRLADTPFATMPDATHDTPLKRAERLNVVFVLAASQLAQILVLAVVTAVTYLILGAILLNPPLLKEWTHSDRSAATVLGFTLPVPHSLIHMCLFIGALTFMYISARAAGDAEYRSTFLDPLIDDMSTALIARDRYRSVIEGSMAAPAAARRVDATHPSD